MAFRETRMRFGTIARSVLSTVVAAGVGMAHASGLSAPVVIPIAPYLGAIPSLQVSVGGHASTFLLDTAGGMTVFTPEGARAAGCKPWGQMTGFRMRGDRVDTSRCDNVRLSLAGVTVEVPQAGVWDFSKLLPKDAPPLGGSIALDAFAGRVVTLDLSAGKFILETPASLGERIHHATEVPMRLVREVGGAALVPVVAIDTPKGRVWMELDCGSDGEVIVNRPLAEALGLDPETRGAQPLAMSLAGAIAVKAKGQVQDLVIDGNIGAPVLKQWVITLDLAHEKLWLAPKT